MDAAILPRLQGSEAPNKRPGMLTIAAIIPLYNGAAYIEAALKSVLDQERPADEIIVVDDGSTDNGFSIVAAMAVENPKIRLLQKKNGGQSSARNYGVAHCNSDLIALLDQDDCWYGNHLKELESAFAEEAEDARLGYIYSNVDRVDPDGTMVHQKYLNHFKTEEHPKTTLIGCLKEDMYILPSATLVSKSAFQSVDGFDERLRGFEDDDLFLKLFCAGFRSVYIDRALSVWRIHSRSSSASVSMLISAQVYYDKLIDTFENKTEIRQDIVADVIAQRFALFSYRAFRSYLKQNRSLADSKLALDFALKCMRKMRWAGRARMQLRISKYIALFYFKQLFEKRDVGSS